MNGRLRVTAAYVAVQNGMGQQIADAALVAALRERSDLEVQPYPVGSLRTSLDVRRRLPFAHLDAAPFRVKQLVGAAAYPRTLVHRFDCRLPPAPHEVVTVHDLAPLRFPDEGTWPRHVGEGLRRARAVVCPSQFSADEVSAEYGLTNVHVVQNGLDPAFLEAQPLPNEELRRLGVPPRYVLHTGGATRRKNLPALAEAWRAVRQATPDVDLVLCGPPDARRTELFGSLPGTHLLGKVARERLVGLMAGASVVVVPSTYEGYGLPAAEAMACGVPVVAARCASLPEVLGDVGILVTPDSDGLAAGLSDALAGTSERLLDEGRTEARSRTWSASAGRYASIYQTAQVGADR